MADRPKSSSSRTPKSRTMSSSSRSVRQMVSSSEGAGRDLLSREEEYKRLNAELEAKTATLIQEAEDVMREQESMLSHSLNRLELSDALENDGFSSDIFDTEPAIVSDDISKPSSIPATNLARPGSGRGRPPSASSNRPSSVGRGRTNSSARARLPSGGRPPSANLGGAAGRPPSKNKKRPKSRTSGSAADDVAIPGDDMGDFSLVDTINAIEGRIDDNDVSGEAVDVYDDVLPQAAEGMGSEATIRFLKAKLRVMQEELDHLDQECNQKEETNSKLESKIKELEDEKTRTHRTQQNQQAQLDKYKKLSEDAKRKSDGLETQLAGLRKELDGLKRSQKQSATSHGATEVRLNRALEEVEKYKAELQKAKSTSRETTDLDKRRMDQLQAENRRLEKQKNELMAGFKKQLKLIDVLKKQKMHIEAAKMLSFTEEEFVKALEWGT